MSAFRLHNETGNVWTHLLGLPVFIALLVRELMMPIDVPYYRVVAAGYMLACIFMLASSTFFHLVREQSKLVYDRAVKVDLTGVVAVTVCSFLVGIRYGFYCTHNVAMAYLIIVSILGSTAIFWAWSPSLLENLWLTIFFFASFTAFSLVPLIHWIIIIGGAGSEQADVFLWKFLAMLSFYLMGFLAFSYSWPERMRPGRFDLVGHGHQIWHVGVLAGVLQFYVAMRAYATYWSTHECPV